MGGFSYVEVRNTEGVFRFFPFFKYFSKKNRKEFAGSEKPTIFAPQFTQGELKRLYNVFEKLINRVMNQKIRIKLRSYDHNLVDKSTEKIVKTVRATNAAVVGPIPLPTEKEIFTVLRSPHVNKKAREQFQLRTHKRLLEIYSPNAKTVDALSKLELPSGVDIQVKLM